MFRGILFAMLYGFLAWVIGGLVVSLIAPLLGPRDPQAAGSIASLLVFLFLGLPAAVIGFRRHRR